MQIILLGVILIFYSCADPNKPESWNSFAGKMVKKSFVFGCEQGGFFSSLKNLPDDSGMINFFDQESKEDFCNCLIEKLILIYPAPIDFPGGRKGAKQMLNNSNVIRAINECDILVEK